MCNCGSKVFFDSLGDPWPRHDCHTSWARALPRTTSARGTTVQLSPHVSITRPSATFRAESVDRSVARGERRKREAIAAINPVGGSVKEVVGVLRELTRSLGVIRALKLEDTSMTHALLGPLGGQPMGRITIHQSSEPGYFESFTCWIPSELVEDPRLKRGLTVVAVLEALALPDGRRVWFCDDFQLVG
jgi:hypothetical protein